MQITLWMDQEVAPVDIRKQWQQARANRRMQFKLGNYRDGSWKSNILLFDRATRRNRKDPYEEKRYRGADIDAVTRYWKQCGSWMAQYKGYVEPYTFNFKKLLKALYHKEGAAQSTKVRHANPIASSST